MLATGFTDLLDALGGAVRTDIPRSALGDFAIVVDRFQQHGGTTTVRTLHLAPPFYQSSHWQADEVRALVTEVLTPPAPLPTGPTATPVPGDGTTTTAGGLSPALPLLDGECH